MANSVNNVIAVAKSEIGYLEKKTNAQLDDKTANAGHGNFTKYARDLDAIKFYNGPKNGFDWCAVFIGWLFTQVFGMERAQAELFLPPRSSGASCTYIARRFKAQGRLFAADPQVGDLILYTRDGGTTFYHIGLVTKVDAQYIWTIEGNTLGGSTIVANGGGVFEKKYRRSAVSAWYARPVYDAEQETAPDTEPEKTEIGTEMFTKTDAEGRILDIGLKVDHGTIWYQVHTLNGRWLPAVTGFDPNNFVNGYAGNHTLIDAIRVYYYTPKGEPYKQARYAVQTEKSGTRWLPEQVDDSTKNGMDGYAGNFGEAITGFKWRVDNK